MTADLAAHPGSRLVVLVTWEGFVLQLDSLLENQWVYGEGAQEQVKHPVSGALVALADSGGLDLARALAFARDVGGPALRTLTFAQRGAMLKAMSEVIHGARDELLDLSLAVYGATRGDAKFDIDGASGTLAYYAKLGAELGAQRILRDGEAVGVARSARFVGQHLIVPRHGVGLCINAFNFPAWGMGEKLATCLLAGMPALVKPATSTAAVAHRIVKLWHDAGILPAGALSLLCGEPRDLLDHVTPQDAVAFTGSARTGRLIRAHQALVAAACPVSIEADSLNAYVLGPDVEPGSDTFEMCLREIVGELTQKAGQKCTAVRRIFVPVERLDDVKEGLEDLLSHVVTGDPAERHTRVGPLTGQAQREAYDAGLAQLSQESDLWVEAPGDLPETGAFVRAHLRLVRDTASATQVHRLEVFGPVASVLTYDGSAQAAAELVAAGRGGLVCGLYSDDLDFVGPVLEALLPWHGRIWWGSRKVADSMLGPGAVLPDFIHGGPGEAGGGEELGGLRGLALWQHRVALQGDRVLLDRWLSQGQD